jgi:hypothetical protein
MKDELMHEDKDIVDVLEYDKSCTKMLYSHNPRPEFI